MASKRGAFLVCACCVLYSQTADKSLTFEVASVKLSAPTGGRGTFLFAAPSGGPGSKIPNRIHYPGMALKNVLLVAYDVKNFQIEGPSWLDTERFDIDATMPPETTREQMRTMLQNLLAERFKLTVHRETKDLPMYTLLVAKSGPKMKESAAAPAPKTEDTAPAMPPPPPPLRPDIGPDGFPVIPMPPGRPNIFTIQMPGRARMIAQMQTMQDLAARLTMMMNRPVTDATELTAKYDFVITYSPEGMNGPMGPMPPPPAGSTALPTSASELESLPDIFGAVQSQLGLRLESKRGPVTMVIIDHIEKTPTEN